MSAGAIRMFSSLALCFFLDLFSPLDKEEGEEEEEEDVEVMDEFAFSFDSSIRHLAAVSDSELRPPAPLDSDTELGRFRRLFSAPSGFGSRSEYNTIRNYFNRHSIGLPPH